MPAGHISQLPPNCHLLILYCPVESCTVQCFLPALPPEGTRLEPFRGAKGREGGAGTRRASLPAVAGTRCRDLHASQQISIRFAAAPSRSVGCHMHAAGQAGSLRTHPKQTAAANPQACVNRVRPLAEHYA